jgi:hypothetical protein
LSKNFGLFPAINIILLDCLNFCFRDTPGSELKGSLSVQNCSQV